MAPAALVEPVATLMRTVAAEVVMPRFRALAEGEIIEKAPGDLVTVADREAEARLAEGLSRLLPSARMIGEEACAADPTLLDNIGEGCAWIVDPIDGTHNYASGIRPFAIMVALVEEGETQAGWILDAASGRLCHAVAGGGAFVDGEAVCASGTGEQRPVAALALRYLPADLRERLIGRMTGKLSEAAIPLCAGEQYPRVVLGENDVALFWRALPWDHAPGALFLAEAGGRLARFDGTPYRVDQTGTGLIAAATPALWDEAARILVG